MIATAEDARNLTTKRTHEKMQVTSQRIKELALETVIDKYLRKIERSANNCNSSITLIACNSMLQVENCKISLKDLKSELETRGFNFKSYLFGFIQVVSWKDQITQK